MVVWRFKIIISLFQSDSKSLCLLYILDFFSVAPSAEGMSSPMTVREMRRVGKVQIRMEGLRNRPNHRKNKAVRLRTFLSLFRNILVLFCPFRNVFLSLFVLYSAGCFLSAFNWRAYFLYPIIVRIDRFALLTPNWESTLSRTRATMIKGSRIGFFVAGTLLPRVNASLSKMGTLLPKQK